MRNEYVVSAGPGTMLAYGKANDVYFDEGFFIILKESSTGAFPADEFEFIQLRDGLTIRVEECRTDSVTGE